MPAADKGRCVCRRRGHRGTITGIGEIFKQARPDVLIVGVEPADSAVLSGGKPAPTEIDGLGAGMISDVLNTEIMDRVIAVSNSAARTMSNMKRFEVADRARGGYIYRGQVGMKKREACVVKLFEGGHNGSVDR